jgi:hypothetical protein
MEDFPRIWINSKIISQGIKLKQLFQNFNIPFGLDFYFKEFKLMK